MFDRQCYVPSYCSFDLCQLRHQYNQYAYHLAQQMVRNPVRAQYAAARGQMERGGVHYNEDGEPYESSTSEEEDSDTSSSGDSEEVELESDSDDEYGRRKGSKPKKSRQKREEVPKFVENVRPQGARSSGRLSGGVRKSYTYDAFSFVDDEVSDSSGESEPAERIDKIFATRDHEEQCTANKHKPGSHNKVVCDCKQQFYLKPEGVSYIHCEWLDMDTINERFGRPGVDKVKRFA